MFRDSLQIYDLRARKTSVFRERSMKIGSKSGFLAMHVGEEYKQSVIPNKYVRVFQNVSSITYSYQFEEKIKVGDRANHVGLLYTDVLISKFYRIMRAY